MTSGGYGVKVKELHPLVSNELLHEAFSVFGEVRRAVHLVDKQGRPVFEGEVEFKEEDAAERALRQISEGVFLLTRSQKPVAAQQLRRLEVNIGQPEMTIQRSPEERAVGPRFAVEGTFEAECGQEWKELYGSEHVTLDQVAKDFLTKRRALLTRQDRKQKELERKPDDVDTSHDLLDDARNEFGSAAAEHPVNPFDDGGRDGQGFDGGWGGDEEFEERGSNEQLAFLEEEEARNLSDYKLLQEAGAESGGSNGSWANRTDESPPSAFLLAKSGPVGPRLSDGAPTAPRPHWGTLLNSPRAQRKREAALTGSLSAGSTSGRKRRASSMEAVIPPKRLSYGSGGSMFCCDESAVLTAPATQLVAPAQHAQQHALGNARDEGFEEAHDEGREDAQDHVDAREEAQEEEREETLENEREEAQEEERVEELKEAQGDEREEAHDDVEEEEREEEKREEDEREEDEREEEEREEGDALEELQAQAAPGEPASLNNRPARPPSALKSVREVWTLAEEQTTRKLRGGGGALARTRHGVPVALMPLPNERAEGLRCPHPACATRRRPFNTLRGLRSHVTRSHKDACSRCWERFEDAFTCAVHKELKCTRQPSCPDVGCRTPCRRGLVAHLIEGHHHQ